LIFIRTCEDRELEEKQLIVKLRDWKIRRKGLFIKEIRDLFSYFDQEYNSKLFSKHLCDQLVIGYNPLIEIIEGLYNTSDHFISYDFSAIEADALGNIYEQYLGHILNKTEAGVKLKKNGIHRKKQGIYYTGTFIVDFIVRNSLGELLKDKSIQKEDVRILDPACGSGSFLIKAYDIMYEKYRQAEQYSKDSQTGLDLDFGTGSPFTIKAKIIKENIFGVDLDKQAVEISQLNLLLKITEKGHRLPILQENILCGNSLIEDKNIALDKAFAWNDNFSEILKVGGFDAIIGNPPYIFARDNKFSEDEKQYFYQNYTLGKYQLNSYLLFIEKSINLLKDGGHFGFIVPNTWQTIDSYLPFRKFLFETMSDIKIVNIPKKVFLDANVETSIIIFKKTPQSNKNLTLFVFKENKFEKVYEGHSSVLNENYIVRFDLGSVETIHKTKGIMGKIKSSSIKLDDISTVKSGLKAYEVGKGKPLQTEEMKNNRVYHSKTKIDDSYLRYLNGEDVDRYQIKWGGEYL
jgi:type I restriction-modification system DNA methylase subunit